MENLFIYDSARECPPEALRQIQAGKLKGKSDINPMWRIKKLTDLFGPCGIGWKTFEESFWITPGANGEMIAWCSLKLCYRDKESGDWSDPVFGIGGSMLVDTQRGSLTSNDDAYKMAHTDAISVACKQLGFAANVYWGQDRTKYSAVSDEPKFNRAEVLCADCGKPVTGITKCGVVQKTADEVIDWSRDTFNGETYCWACAKKRLDQREGS